MIICTVYLVSFSPDHQYNAYFFCIVFQFHQTFKSSTLAGVQHHWWWRSSCQVEKQNSLWRFKYLLFGRQWEQCHLNLSVPLSPLHSASIQGWCPLALMNTSFSAALGCFAVDMCTSFTKADQTKKHFNGFAISLYISIWTNKNWQCRYIAVFSWG